MRRFELETHQVRQVTWQTGLRTWALRKTGDPGFPRVEVERDQEVALRVSVHDLLLLRDAIDVLVPPAWEDDGFDRDGGPAPWTWSQLPDPIAHDRPTRSGQPWTPREDDRIRELYAAGERPEDIAEKVARTTAGVHGRLLKLGIPRRDAPAPGQAEHGA